MKNFFEELRRRKVFTVALLYAGAAWLLLQVADTVFPIIGAPDWGLRTLLTLLVLGFPLAMVLGWAYDLKAGHIVRDPDDVAAEAKTKRLEGATIAVVPFRALGKDEDQAVFAEAITEDIITGLTQHPTVSVLASGATRHLAGATLESEAVGQELGVRHLLQGTVQTSGGRLRVSAQLTDTTNGVQTWAESYDRELDAANLFDLQDEIRDQIVATVSDVHGVIFAEGIAKNRQRPTESLDAYECVMSAMVYDKTLREADHLRARELFERAVELDPDYGFAWAHLSWIYADEWLYGYNPRPDSMERALGAARKGVELAGGDYHVRWLLSRVHFFMGDREQFLSEARKSLDLNSSDGTTLGLIGLYMALAGEWEEGIALVEKAKTLNPHFPIYYYVATGLRAFAEGRDGEAASELKRMENPEWPLARALLAGALAEGGELQSARDHWKNYRDLKPQHRAEDANADILKFLQFVPDVYRRMSAGVEKAAASP